MARRSAKLSVSSAFGLVLALAAEPVSFAGPVEVRVCEDPVQQPSWKTTLFENDSALFTQEGYTDVSAWPAESELAPGIRDCFGSGTPHSRAVLLHEMPRNPFVETKEPHPVLLIPGAGDNAVRAFGFMSWEMIALGFNVYALTFAHPHGDNYQHAEHIGAMLAEISRRHGGAKVDVITHSMGGIAARIYASNDGSVDWGARNDGAGERYEELGRVYGGEIRKLVFLGTPHGGVDTSYRWPNSNFTRILGEPTASPLSWDAYYPLGTINLAVREDLSELGFFAEPAVFAGQAQVLARWNDRVALPGETPELGTMSLQQDWLTTYEGGLGFVSESRGIDAAIARGGGLVEKLRSIGLAPDIEVYVAAGRNPIIPMEDGLAFLPSEQRQDWGARIRDEWPELERDWFDPVMPWHEAWGAELDHVFAGRSIFGEVSAPSDGIVFAESVTATSSLGLRGARVIEIRLFDRLNHLELTYASALASRFFGNAELAKELFDPVASEKYADPANQVVQWIARSLKTTEPEPPLPDAGVPGSDADASSDGGGPAEPFLDAGTMGPDAGTSEDNGESSDGSWGCAAFPGEPASLSVWWALLLALLPAWRSRRRF